ncbi:MAG: tetratricopeptide repeat protein [Verrucomicrobia bacterium]|nr:tetratricopeptide repeat protein [Verrucomicrobiota bacterium]
MGFSTLQTRANELAEEGRLIEALPLLKELVKRVEATEDSDVKLDFPLYLIGTGYIQTYLQSQDKQSLEEALKWYDKLAEEYPNSPHMKDMLLKRVDVLRTLGRNDEAIEQMRQNLSGENPSVRLSYSERVATLRNMTQIHYNSGQFEEGLPYFGQFLEIARDPEDKALAAAASFEALFKANRIDDAINLVPLLARDASIRYLPRLNVALLEASDILVSVDRFNEATIVLNLIKTTDVMIEWHENRVRELRGRKEQRVAFGNTGEAIEQIDREIKRLEGNLEKLADLPTLRTELLVRRARNYTQTERRYEAFWMFYGLSQENPDDTQIEYYYYAAFSNALQIAKNDTAITLAEDYLRRFPEGDYYSDVSGALAVEYQNAGEFQRFESLVVDLIGRRPLDQFSASLFARWAAYLIERERYAELINQAAEWFNAEPNAVYADGVFYWGGLAELQLRQFEGAIDSFKQLLSRYPQSAYAEDGLVRKGVAEFYAGLLNDAHETLVGYIEKYPNGHALDQAYFFLGETEYVDGGLDLALEYLGKADEVTEFQDIHDAVAFRVGDIYEAKQEFDAMVAHFQSYMEQYGETGNLTRAVLRLGQAFENLLRPVDMLELYREYIAEFSTDPDNAGVDALVESYAEKYNRNKTKLTATVDFFDRMENDLEFREKIVTDRGFLFEQFYNNDNLDEKLYNRMRNDPNFTKALLDDLSPIDDLIAPYRDQLALFPRETPEAFFRDQLARFRAQENIIAETRILMGLYRLDIELEPSEPFDMDLVRRLTPRAILYVADYERNKRIDLAEEAWNWILQTYPTDDATIVAYMRLADISADDGRTETALEYLEQIVEGFPGSSKIPAVLLRQGQLLTELGRGGEAREKYQYILRVPEWRGVFQARAIFQIGQSYMAEQEYAKAHGFFERTFLGYPHLSEWSARAYLADAEALIGMGAENDAINTLNEAVEELGGVAPADIMEAINRKLGELQT